MEDRKDTDGLFSGNPLKGYSTEEIEKTISTSISNLVGKELDVNIHFIEYPQSNKRYEHGNPVEIRMVLTAPFKKEK